MTIRSGQGPLIITGMHRSGTSMTAGLLRACGLDLGSRMIEPTIHNPRGFNEHADIVALQERILMAATDGPVGEGAPWGYVVDGSMDPSQWRRFEDEARAYLREREKAVVPAWGWKDPRTTLLLDFWLGLAPELVTCLVYRDPWDVVASLTRVVSSELTGGGKALDLWLHYNRALLDFRRDHPERCLLVSSLRVLEQPDQLPRLLSDKFGLNLEPRPEVYQDIDTNLLGAPKHPRVIEEALAHPGVPEMLDALHAAADMPGVLPGYDGSRVSVIIPCYNDGQWLPEAVASVTRGRLPNVEIMIVDDGSDDPATINAVEEMESFGCRVVRQRNEGVSAALNVGVKAARGDFVFPLGCDDRIHPNFIVELVGELQRDPGIDVAYGGICFFGDRNELYRPGPFDLVRLLTSNYFSASGMIRRRAWDETGGYDESIPRPGGYGDWEFWVRLAEEGRRFAYREGFFFDCRIRPDSLTAECLLPENSERLILEVAERHEALYRERGAEVFVSLRSRYVHQMLADRRQHRAMEARIRDLEASLNRLAAERRKLHDELRQARKQRDRANRKRRKDRARRKRTWVQRVRAVLRDRGGAPENAGEMKHPESST